MSNSEIILSQIRQRLEILYQMVDELEAGGGGGGGTTNYNDLTNKPSINDQVLTGNKSLSELGAATPSDIAQAFAPSTITLVEGGTFPSNSRTLLTEHKPINVNDTQYYFLEESSVDYLYGSLPASGAYPSLSYLRIIKESFTVEFHNTEIDTVPTDGSDNLITSGAVYDAVQGGGGTDLTPTVIIPTSRGDVKFTDLPILEKHLPIQWRANGLIYTYLGEFGGNYNYYCFGVEDYDNGQSYRGLKINKTTGATTAYSERNGSPCVITLASTVAKNFYDSADYLTRITGDLNSQYNAGVFSITNASDVSNYPTTETGILSVNRNYKGNAIIQTLTTTSGIPTIFIRIREDVTWGSWYKFEGTLVS